MFNQQIKIIINDLNKFFNDKYRLFIFYVKNFKSEQIYVFSFLFFWAFVIILNTGLYMNYLDITHEDITIPYKVSSKTFISKYKLNNYSNERLTSEMLWLKDESTREIELNSALDKDSLTWTLAFSWWKIIELKKENITNSYNSIIGLKSNNNEENSTWTKDSSWVVIGEFKEELIKIPDIQVSESGNLNSWTWLINSDSWPVNSKEKTTEIISKTESEPIKILVDSLSISINNELQTQLNKLNNNIFNSFKIKILKDTNLFLENWVRYTYVFNNYNNFWKWVVPTIEDLLSNWLNPDTTILLLDEEIGTSYVTDYRKVKLISDNIISWITNKHTFLKELSDDKKYLQLDTDDLFINLKNDTSRLTLWLNSFQKVQKIYDYILKNITYSSVFDTNNKYIFSWIYTYENKTWICSWYAKLYLYMLSFAWIDYVRVVKWNILDAPDFPNIWHAWIQILNNYYDPTFDDTWNWWLTKTPSEYKYFALPKDLFYANRFDYWTLPEDLKNSTIEVRNEYIKNELEKLKLKYWDTEYNLFK